MAKTDELSGIEGPGVSPVKNKRLDNAIAKWRGIVATRMDLTEQEVKAKEGVVGIMHELNIGLYRYQDDDDEVRVVILDTTEKLKFKKSVVEVDEDDDKKDGD